MFKHKEALCLIWREEEDYVYFIAISSLFQSERAGLSEHNQAELSVM